MKQTALNVHINIFPLFDRHTEKWQSEGNVEVLVGLKVIDQSLQISTTRRTKWPNRIPR